jgi:hypothetical protein
MNQYPLETKRMIERKRKRERKREKERERDGERGREGERETKLNKKIYKTNNFIVEIQKIRRGTEKERERERKRISSLKGIGVNYQNHRMDI